MKAPAATGGRRPGRSSKPQHPGEFLRSKAGICHRQRRAHFVQQPPGRTLAGLRVLKPPWGSVLLDGVEFPWKIYVFGGGIGACTMFLLAPAESMHEFPFGCLAPALSTTTRISASMTTTKHVQCQHQHQHQYQHNHPPTAPTAHFSLLHSSKTDSVSKRYIINASCRGQAKPLNTERGRARCRQRR